jgi:hypothetical protein
VTERNGMRDVKREIWKERDMERERYGKREKWKKREMERERNGEVVN